MKTLQTLLLLLITTFAMAEVSNETIYFDKASFSIDNVEQEKLQTIANATKIILKGHTDKDGDEQYNLELSKNRVEAVKQSLIAQGIDERAIEVSYYGEDQPLNQNLDDVQMSLNRRVEITTTDDPLLGFYQEKQTFVFNNDNDTIILGDEGTKIHIPAMAFGGSSINISLQEFYQLEDILSANLNTHADDRLLETAGMIYIEAIDEMTNLPIQPNRPIQIEFPTIVINTDYQLFDGNFDENMTMNWTVNSPSTTNINTVVLEEEIQISDLLRDGRVFNSTSNYINYSMLQLSDQELKNRLTQKLYTVYGVDFIDNNISYALYEGIDGWVNFIEEPQCFDKSRAIVSIDEHGFFYEATTSHGEFNPHCDTIVKNELSKINQLKKIPSEAQSHSVDFLSIDIVTDEEVQAYRDSLMSLLANDPYYNSLLASAQTDNLVFSTMDLGWINCDRFYNTTETVPLAIHTEHGAQVRVIFKNIESVMSAYSNGGIANINRVPLNEEIIIIATKMNGKTPEYAIFETNVSQMPIVIDEYEDLDVEIFKEKLKKIKA
ncbi:MAG: OmpA family protein [Chitinophagales bacterium]